MMGRAMDLGTRATREGRVIVIGNDGALLPSAGLADVANEIRAGLERLAGA